MLEFGSSLGGCTTCDGQVGVLGVDGGSGFEVTGIDGRGVGTGRGICNLGE